MPVANPDSWGIVALLTPGFCGNGVGLHAATGKIYVSSEGNFLPGGGAVFEVDPSVAWGGNARVLVDGLFASDGLWIDQAAGTLYVGLLFTAEVFAYDLLRNGILGTFSGLAHTRCGFEVLCAMVMCGRGFRVWGGESGINDRVRL